MTFTWVVAIAYLVLMLPVVFSNSGRSQDGAKHWRDLVLFYEDFHGDNATGIGAS